MRISRPTAVVLDIEGTITDTHFSSRTLYPFMRNNVIRFLKSTYNVKTTQQMINRLRTTQERIKCLNKHSKKCPNKQTRLIPTKDGNNSRQVVLATANFVKFLYDFYPNTVELLELQLLMWVWAAENNLLKGQFYEDVTNTLHVWKHKNKIKTFIYSSALIVVQQLMFCCSNRGNLLPLIDGFFDYKHGDKLDPASYSRIVESIHTAPNQVLYITDSLQEGQSALVAGLKVAIIQRDTKRSSIKHSRIVKRFSLISSLEDVYFKA